MPVSLRSRGRHRQTLPEVLPRSSRTCLGAINGQVEETFSGQNVVRAFCQRGARRRSSSTPGERDACTRPAGSRQFLSGLMHAGHELRGQRWATWPWPCSGSVLAAAGVITVGDIQAFIQYVQATSRSPSPSSRRCPTSCSPWPPRPSASSSSSTPPRRRPSSPGATHRRRASATWNSTTCASATRPARPSSTTSPPVCARGRRWRIVGPTGAGKTTMVKLLMRFYDVSGGAIRIGGHDVRELRPQRPAPPVRHGAAGHVAVQGDHRARTSATASSTPPTRRSRPRRRRPTRDHFIRTLPRRLRHR